MNVLELFRRRAANNTWSNFRLHRACAALDPADYHAPRTSFFPSIPRTLNHILIVDWYYLDALERGGNGRAVFADEMPFLELDALARAQRATDLRLFAFVEGLAKLGSGEALDAEVRLDRPEHVQVERVGDVLTHLDTHQIHHRGQVHAMLAGTPVKPPPLDEFFLSGDLPLREEELRALGLPLQ